MRVELTVTLDGSVEGVMRALSRSRVARGWKQGGQAAMGLLVGLLVFGLLLGARGAALGAGSAVVAALAFGRVYEHVSRWHLRRLCREQLGSDGSAELVVELLPDAVSARWLGRELRFEWIILESIREEPELVELLFSKGGYLTLWRSGFSGPEQVEAFIALARRYAEAAELLVKVPPEPT
ncbi:MAG: hypothetical protein HYU66_00370 [Armatimonadetes bacterium]|nr:hypothetical protein [Armatimonadota bacterium]